MGKTVGAFLSGLFVATVIFKLYDSPLETDMRDNAAVEELASAQTATEAPSSTDEPTEIQQPNPPHVTESTDSVKPSGPPNREQALRDLIAGTREALAAYETELRSLETERLRAQQPIAMPMPLSPEFKWLSESTVYTHYDAIQREYRDTPWATMTEGQIRAYLDANPEITQTFGVPTIECRTSRCAVAFVQYGIDKRQNEIAAAFRTMTRNYREHFSKEQTLLFNLDVNSQNGVATVYWTLFNPGRLPGPRVDEAAPPR